MQLRKCRVRPAERSLFSLDFVYTLPKVKNALDQPVLRQVFNAWELSGVIRYQSGMLVNITSNGNLFGLNIGATAANSPILSATPMPERAAPC